MVGVEHRPSMQEAASVISAITDCCHVNAAGPVLLDLLSFQRNKNLGFI
jgi:hypothetical protein